MSFGDETRPEPIAPDPLAAWPAFVEATRARLESGRAAYGDRSFTRSPGELLGEIEQEVIDTCAWSFILYCQLQSLKARLERGSEANG